MSNEVLCDLYKTMVFYGTHVLLHVCGWSNKFLLFCDLRSAQHFTVHAFTCSAVPLTEYHLRSAVRHIVFVKSCRKLVLGYRVINTSLILY